MNLTREDMLRELELLPVWQLRPEAALATLVPLPVPNADQHNLTPATTQATEPAIESLAEPMPVSNENEAHDLQETQAQTEPKIATAWLLYCPEADAHEAYQTMLTNIIHAMQLLPSEYVVAHSAQDLTRYQAQKIVLFGLQALQQVAGAQAQDIEAMRGMPQSFDGRMVWVTYHPAQMLANPALKRGAWQDICAALSHR